MEKDIKILYITDTHLVAKEVKNKRDAFNSSLYTLNSIKDLVKENKIDILIQGGDFFDRGNEIENIEYVNKVEKEIKEISSLVQGNFFMVMGNHEFTYSRNNIVYKFLDIQDKTVRDSLEGYRILHNTLPLIKVIPGLTIGQVGIHCVHWSKSKQYKINNTDNKVNIGLYHDSITTLQTREEVFLSKKENAISVEETDIMENIDIALLAHIHKPMEPVTLNNKRETKVYTIGSMTSNNISETHSSVKLPIITIYKEPIEENLGIDKYIKFELIDYKLEDYNSVYDIKTITEEKEKREETKEILHHKMVVEKEVDYQNFKTGLSEKGFRYLSEAATGHVNLDSKNMWNNYIEKYRKI